MNTWRTTGSTFLTLSPRPELSTGTSRQPSNCWPSAAIFSATSFSHAARAAASRGRNSIPTPYSPAGGSWILPQPISSRRNWSGIWIKIPAPSPANGSAPTAPRCVRFFRICKPWHIMSWLCLPLIWATKPTPQASCSWRGSYKPCCSGNPCCIGKELLLTAFLGQIIKAKKWRHTPPRQNSKAKGRKVYLVWV